MTKLLIDLLCLMILLYFVNSLFLWIFIRSYREEMNSLYMKLELLKEYMKLESLKEGSHDYKNNIY